jgi:conjugal transfer pilus assembly protein TraB
MTTDESLSVLPDERKTRRRQIIVVVLACIAVGSLVVYAYYKSIPPENLYKAKEKSVVTRKVESPAPVDEREMWRAHSQKELLQLRKDNQRISEKVDQLTVTLASIQKEKRTETSNTRQRQSPLPIPSSTRSPIPSPITTLPAPPPRTQSNATLLPPPPGLNPSSYSPTQRSPSRTSTPGRNRTTQTTSANAGIFIMDISDPSNQAIDGERIKTVDNYLPPGTYIKTRLLSGLDAPTGGAAQRDPVPFLVRLKDNGQLPNGFRSRVKHCFVTLAGVGNISDNRVYGRSEKLSCVLKDKTIFTANIKAYISGEDGKAGMRGAMVSKRGQLVAYSLLSGLGGGFGEAISQSFTTISTNPQGSTSSVDTGEIGKFGLAQGVGTALDRISQWYLDRADETFPILEVNAGRTPELVLLDGIYFGNDDPSRSHKTVLITQANKEQAGALETTP